jgi:hypothetical protein
MRETYHSRLSSLVPRLSRYDYISGTGDYNYNIDSRCDEGEESEVNSQLFPQLPTSSTELELHTHGILHQSHHCSQTTEAVLSNTPILTYSRLSCCIDFGSYLDHQDTSCKLSFLRS